MFFVVTRRQSIFFAVDAYAETLIIAHFICQFEAVRVAKTFILERPTLFQVKIT